MNNEIKKMKDKKNQEGEGQPLKTWPIRPIHLFFSVERWRLKRNK